MILDIALAILLVLLAPVWAALIMLFVVGVLYVIVLLFAVLGVATFGLVDWLGLVGPKKKDTT